MPLRQPSPIQRHANLQAEFQTLVRQRKDMDPASPAYAQKSTQIDAILTEVWSLGTIYSRTPGAFEPV